MYVDRRTDKQAAKGCAGNSCLGGEVMGLEGVLVLAGIELIFFVVAHTVLFWICDQNSVEKTLMFYLFLNSAYTASRSFPFLTLPHQREGWGCTRTWEGTQPGPQLTKGIFHTI